jgi:hypothetical protein
MSGARKSKEATATRTGRPATNAAHDPQTPPPGFFLRRNAGILTALTLAPSRPSTAGRNVIAASTAVTTATAEARPRVLSRGMPATRSDTRATTTVPPANTIALPEVATARAIESSTGIPASSCS